MQEPRIHSAITDGLPDDHPLAFRGVNCETCQEALHAGNNECMQTWVETRRGGYCLRCFASLAERVDLDATDGWWLDS